MNSELDISEIFYSIQGESRFAGRPCIFVRLAGCPLNCKWCDTAYARSVADGNSTRMTLDDVLASVESYDCKLVELTGGEPLVQDAAFELLCQLCKREYTVLLETSGAVDISRVDPCVIRIMDVKCPSSGMADRMLAGNYQYLGSDDELKFVVADRVDFDSALATIARYDLAERCTLNFSPVADLLDPAELAKWLLDDCPQARLNLQLHRIIWPEQERGV